MKNFKKMAVLALVFVVAGTVQAVKVFNIKGGVTVVNNTKSRIFVHSYALTPSCGFGGCSYNSIDKDKSYLPSGTLLLGRNSLVIVAPIIENGVAKILRLISPLKPIKWKLL